MAAKVFVWCCQEFPISDLWCQCQNLSVLAGSSQNFYHENFLQRLQMRKKKPNDMDRRGQNRESPFLLVPDFPGSHGRTRRTWRLYFQTPLPKPKPWAASGTTDGDWWVQKSSDSSRTATYERLWIVRCTCHWSFSPSESISHTLPGIRHAFIASISVSSRWPRFTELSAQRVLDGPGWMIGVQCIK